MKYKAYLPIVLAAILLLTMTACGKTQSPAATAESVLLHSKHSCRRFRKPRKLSRPIGRKLLRTSLGRPHLRRACLITMECFRNTMRIWGTASIRSMWRWAARSSPSSRSTPPQAITMDEGEVSASGTPLAGKAAAAIVTAAAFA